MVNHREVSVPRIPFFVVLIIAAASTNVFASEPKGIEGREVALAQLDLQQKEMVGKADADGLAALSAPGLTINAPTGRVLTRAQFLAMMRNGQIGAESFERTVESVTVSGDVGVVMGSEIFTPTAQSELGGIYGAVPLKRRYTNIYIRRGGAWRWFARHANVVPTK